MIILCFRILLVVLHVLSHLIHNVIAGAGEKRTCEGPNEEACRILVCPLRIRVESIDWERELLPDDNSHSKSGVDGTTGHLPEHTLDCSQRNTHD